MREIKFRALQTDKWKKGIAVWEISGETCYADDFWRWINDGTLDKKTLGQYIGRKDKNGKEIYERDIVINTAITYSKKHNYKNNVVKDIRDKPWWIDCSVEVIGNSCEIKELLKG